MRLIDADALLKEFEENENALIENGFAPQLVDSDIVTVYVNQQPTIEAKPVVHAHWDNVSGGRTICTNCGNYPLYDYFGRLKLSEICPHCGAQMDEEVKENV